MSELLLWSLCSCWPWWIGRSTDGSWYEAETALNADLFSSSEKVGSVPLTSWCTCEALRSLASSKETAFKVLPSAGWSSACRPSRGDASSSASVIINGTINDVNNSFSSGGADEQLMVCRRLGWVRFRQALINVSSSRCSEGDRGMKLKSLWCCLPFGLRIILLGIG